MTVSAELGKTAPVPALSERLRLLRRRRQSRLLRTAISVAAWLAVSLLGMGFLVGSVLTWAT